MQIESARKYAVDQQVDESAVWSSVSHLEITFKMAFVRRIQKILLGPGLGEIVPPGDGG